MRQLLIATAALALMGGAAFAQTDPSSNPDARSTAPSGITQGGGVAAGSPAQPADGSPGMVSQPPASSPPTTDATPPDAMSTGSTSTTGATASNAPAGPPPETYPVCTSKHEDRCVNRSQATRVASTRHHAKSTDTSGM